MSQQTPPLYQCGPSERRLVYAWEGEVDGLNAEIERLRAALEAICEKYGGDIECRAFELNKIAENAINQQSTNKEG